MVWDIVELREFYAHPLGQATRRWIRRRIGAFWEEPRGQRVLGLGFATPYLRPFLDEAACVVGAMPAAQGIAPWPREGPQRAVLVDESRLPFSDAEFDRILLVHSIEFARDRAALLSECWRVLAGQGRLLAVVANRNGMWARAERTPFGHGVPYSGGQLRKLLKDHQFVPERTGHALFFPPWPREPLLRAAGWLERGGSRYAPLVGGVSLVEASKQLFAASPPAETALVARRPVLVAKPARTALVRRQRG